MESIETKLEDLLSKPLKEKKEEMLQLDNLITKYKSDSQYDDPAYARIFSYLISTRLELVVDSDPDYLYILKAFQTTRLLSRNKTIQKQLYNDTVIKTFENILDKILKIKPSSEIIDNIIIELLSIVKRFFSIDCSTKPIGEDGNRRDYFEKILSSSLIDNMIILLQKDNLILLTLLHILFISILDNEKIIVKFSKAYIVENIILSVKDKSKEVAKIMLDFIIILIENKEFRSLLMFLEGHLILIK